MGRVHIQLSLVLLAQYWTVVEVVARIVSKIAGHNIMKICYYCCCWISADSVTIIAGLFSSGRWRLVK